MLGWHDYPHALGRMLFRYIEFRPKRLVDSRFRIAGSDFRLAIDSLRGKTTAFSTKQLPHRRPLLPFKYSKSTTVTRLGLRTKLVMPVPHVKYHACSAIYYVLSDRFPKPATAAKGTEATLGLDTISSVTLYRIAQYKIPLAFNALYFPYSETTHLFGVNSTD